MPSSAQKLYEQLLPILTLAKCKELANEVIEQDPNLIKALRKIKRSAAYRRLKEYYELESPEYWENLRLMGDCDDLDTLESYKKDLRKLWKECYASEETDSTSS